jgi:Apea-like HEPN
MEQKSPWNQLSEFMTDAQKNLRLDEPAEKLLRDVAEGWASGAEFFSQAELGGLLLDPGDGAKFRACVRTMHKLVAGSHDRISVGAVRDAVKLALLKALDIGKTDSEPDFSKRAAREVSELRKALSRRPDAYVVRLEVQGLKSEDLPRQFGNVKFYVSGENSVPEPQATAPMTKEPRDAERESRIENGRILRRNIVTSMKGKIYSEVEVEAFDDDAAESLAENELRRTLDVLNYFGEFFSDARAKVFLPGEAATSRHIGMLSKKGEAEGSKFLFSHKGPLVPFSFPSSDSPAKGQEAFEKASALLQKRSTNRLDKRILTALRWAGRASTEECKDKAFLYSCISLEALLSNSDRGEISFSFALRGTHLLLEDAGMRERLFRDLKALYGLRSGIVHIGDTDITDTDVAKMRTIAKQAVFTVLVNERFSRIVDDKAFEDWFVRQQLGVVDNNLEATNDLGATADVEIESPGTQL